MPNKNGPPDLSRAEYDILRVLWKAGRQNVREVHEALKPVYGWAYTTTKTMMDRMAAKDLLKREDFHGVFLYEPLITRPAGMARLIEFFADRVLEMDATSVVAMLGQTQAITPEELEELERLVTRKHREE
jgi:BlaI family penicillinase repressor